MDRFPRGLVLLFLGAALLTGAGAQTAARPLHASLANIPGLADSPDSGAFVEVVKALGDLYPPGIQIGVYPFARAQAVVLEGQADFAIPMLRNPEVPLKNLAFQLVSEKMGSLAMVLYSNIKKPLAAADIRSALAKGGPFPYKIVVAAMSESNCPFPATGAYDWESALKMLAAGRIDAIYNAQEDTDLALKKLKLAAIHRELYGYYDDVIIVQKSARGDQVNGILSDLLRKLRASGKLDALYRRVHAPYDPWQPSVMGW